MKIKFRNKPEMDRMWAEIELAPPSLGRLTDLALGQ